MFNFVSDSKETLAHFAGNRLEEKFLYWDKYGIINILQHCGQH
jgi:hypothetical protein